MMVALAGMAAGEDVDGFLRAAVGQGHGFVLNDMDRLALAKEHVAGGLERRALQGMAQAGGEAAFAVVEQRRSRGRR